MSSSDDISVISKRMESMSMTARVRVLRHNKRLQQYRYSPYTIRTKEKEKEKQKEEAIRLGVDLSIFVAEAMFLLSDDIRSMLVFCFWLFKYAGKRKFDGPVVGRVFRVIQYVFVTYIKPKNGVYQDGGKSIQWEQFKTSSYHFAFGVRVLARIVSILEMGGLVKPSGFERYKQEIKNLEENLKSVKDVSAANGFSREAIESNIFHLWKSLFETTPEMINPTKSIVIEIFRPLLNEASRDACSRRLTSLRI
ncbi:hypothetical protein ARALYDRAFT_336605 [Arabidopsis lyrata subsp. lyrata]|uniref:Uncharacterized protein n=1 Tax=Arabidopsis lyrata subsp. lyrata TaxID=81972 RepID=D7KL65_ARALL|nr:uncharacterized protein LOC9329929 [Arabidopsis lyrata subsp. lyrata]EFH70127.1 hypothetical protein ARALYDRAFT_336605 [Arabidopsis lyrata subsp. lyrata]|eukprot:XP_002893868.1 uncharacterized protein LOC9329929 [Arabidopsis lyrata subsp. lyrata]